MDFTLVRFINDPSMNEAIIAWVAEADFTMFEETPEGVLAYISAPDFNEEKFKQVLSAIPSIENIHYEVSLIKDQNWNKEWESNFEPILVAERVFIRAPFHEEGNKFEYRITIEPKMSFGTGHHATTALMIELMLLSNIAGNSVLDMGCGTAVLSIFAEKLGASKILAIDIDEWAFENSIENIQRNNCTKILVKKGDVSLIKSLDFEVILANINRNVLLNDMQAYSDSLLSGGELYLSGILISDKEIVKASANNAGLIYQHEASRDNWLAMHFKKK